MSTTAASFNSSITSSGSSALSSTASETLTTPSSSTSAAPSSTPSSGPPWTLSLFAEPGCHGDHYDFTALSGTASYCSSRPSQLSVDRGNVSCTYGRGDSATSGNCTGGPWPLTPKSWDLKDNICTSFRNAECKVPLKGGFSFDTGEGCSDAPVYLSFIGSLSCIPSTPSCKTCAQCCDECLDSGAQDMDM